MTLLRRRMGWKYLARKRYDITIVVAPCNTRTLGISVGFPLSSKTNSIAPNASKPSLAIVSTFDSLCGIAAYTRKLVPQLEDEFDIEVFDLDQYFMRARGGRLAKVADQQIVDMCRSISAFDHVNIQLEFGTLGVTDKQILKRLGLFLDAAKSVTVTFHTILRAPNTPTDEVRSALFRVEIYKAYSLVRNYRAAKKFYKSMYGLLRETQKTKPLAAIVHTERDARLLKWSERVDRVAHHPLAFVAGKDAQAIKKTANIRQFSGLSDLPNDAVVIGVFGFLGRYKGMHTAIDALQLLPEKYHLAIFGGLHPQEVNESPDVHPYVGRLMGQVSSDKPTPQALADVGKASVEPDLDERTSPLKLRSPEDIPHRVHFMGTQSDEDLERAICAVDLVVLPYFEVGQSASGPMSLAVDLDARIIASRNLAFMEFARYHPNRFSLFEIGNHIELAQRVLAEQHASGDLPKAACTTVSNAELYHKAILGEKLAL